VVLSGATASLTSSNGAARPQACRASAAHAFRHLFAHTLLSAGMQETDLMRLAGWRSRQMVARYAASAGTDRAIAAYRRMAPSDKY
jgi:hypothetical protein